MSEEEPEAEVAPPKPGPASRRPRSRSPLKKYLLLLITGFALILLGDELGFFLFLMLMGAALSYLGDQLGSYTGKQRLSILGLRPKYTANVINLLTGLAITAMTLFGAGYMSENVRIALSGVRELRQQARTLDRERRELADAIETVRSELHGLSSKYQETLRLNQSLDEERGSLLEEKQELEQSNDALAARFEDLGRANDRLEKDLSALEERRMELNASIEDKRAEIQRLNRALEKKETAPVVIPRGQVLLEDTVAIPFDVTTSALAVLVKEAAERVRTRVELLDVGLGEDAVGHLVDQGVQVVSRRMDEIRGFFEAEAKGRPGGSGRPRECHLTLVSTRNVSVGERLSRIAFEVKPNVRVFAAGTEVARTMVDGELPRAEILDQLLYFDKQVQGVLRERGVAGSALRRPGALQDSERLLELVGLAQRADARGGPVPVRCVVIEDMYAFGDPAVRFEVMVPEGEGASPETSSAPAEAPVSAAALATRGAEVALRAGERRRSPGILDVEPPVLEAEETAAPVLVLPEPSLSPEGLLEGGAVAVRSPEREARKPPRRGEPGS